MVKSKSVRSRGKLQLSKYFRKFANGDHVAVVREISLQSKFPKRLQGKVGVIEDRRGKAYIVRIKDKNTEKRYIIEPIHLKKMDVFEENK